MKPKVTFIVPCYRLAHLLPECVNSILGQSYKDFEILIMDDCSPDDTPAVACSFKDPRVKHIRNEPNLGHLANYNKGIGLAQGEFVWLISADDRLRQPYVLERFVHTLETHRNVGFVFSPAIGLEAEGETGQVSWTTNGSQDAIWSGRRFLRKLIYNNSVAAPGALVRKRCYTDFGVFPLDLPYAGDWYLWCLFAFHTDVAYFSEPMVNYRLHGLSMTNRLTQHHRVIDNLTVRWRMTSLAIQAADRPLIKACLESIARHYAYCLASTFRADHYALTFEDFESSLGANMADARIARTVRARTYSRFADACYAHHDLAGARQYYLQALRLVPWRPSLWIKLAFLKLGPFGRILRNSWATFCQNFSVNRVSGMRATNYGDNAH